MDIKRMIKDNVLIANQNKEKQHSNVNIKIYKMEYGHTANHVMMVIMIQEMVAIIIKLMIITLVLI